MLEKTTLAKHFAEHIDGIVVFAAFTGKASLVLRSKGCLNASTIHSLIYKATISKDGLVTFNLNRNSIIKDVSLIIIDECSMVDQELGRDLLSFGKPILVLGDPAQLPPIDGAGFFTNHTPDVMLTEIHRQAKDNPIIHLATLARNKQRLKLGTYGDSLITDSINLNCFNDINQVLVGKNDTRKIMNNRARKFLKFDSEDPLIDERIICLQNDATLGIYNGGTFKIVDRLKAKSPNFYKFGIQDDYSPNEQAFSTSVHKSFFRADIPIPNWKVLKGTQQFDYAYAITGHKSQGSQWKSVLVYDESYVFGDNWSRWLYTCITRAEERVEIVMKE